MSGAPTDPVDAVAKIMQSATRLAVLPPDSGLATQELFKILKQIGILARKTIDLQFPVEDSVDEVGGRDNWLIPMFLLSESNLFPGLKDLYVALSDLQRGRQLPSLKPLTKGKGSGSRTTHQALAVQKRAVQAGERIAQLCVKDAALDELLRTCGTSQWTLNTYRKNCGEAAPIYWIEEGAYAELALDDAVLLLKLQIISIRQLRSKRVKST